METAKSCVPQSIQQKVPLPIDWKWNQNRRTFLSVRREKKRLKVSLHQAFLEAPQDVCEALIDYLCGKRKTATTVLREYISPFLTPSLMRKSSFESRGKCYDLLPIYEELNERYFGGQLNLPITWYGRRTGKRRRQMNLGLYCAQGPVIKIHQVLDQPFVPSFVVAFICFHEMLHAHLPPKRGAHGRRQVHHLAFRRAERQFHQFEEAERWIKQNQKYLFAF